MAGTRTFNRYGPVDGRGGFGHASTMAGIAKLWKPVINVTDLDQGERFWSAVSGLWPADDMGSSRSSMSTMPAIARAGFCFSSNG